ncbi:MAG: two-component system chemotaxis family response regulator CheY [Candidatus Saganbacteria bacterium]|uniref:Two-component system chemotaxis family response regulator CheY n=1 Tax=Candidatus Saganbacteria bacterium TaxID=2575572 RepID=A0A833L0M2_UNCSA|nr:MAG: two-component system chemotaxis family response regulator CheY [Candidatus Saganbacteria bacterium]
MSSNPLILVVDDEKPMADKIAEIIKMTNRYNVITAYGAHEAIDLIDNNKRFLGLTDNKIKCIILDLKMPEMDGLQFLKRLRHTEAWFKLMPVIVLTAFEDEEKLQVTTNPVIGNVAAYLKKPFKKEELIDTIDRIFHDEIGHMIDETREKKYKRLDELEAEKKKSQGQ